MFAGRSRRLVGLLSGSSLVVSGLVGFEVAEVGRAAELEKPNLAKDNETARPVLAPVIGRPESLGGSGSGKLVAVNGEAKFGSGVVPFAEQVVPSGVGPADSEKAKVKGTGKFGKIKDDPEPDGLSPKVKVKEIRVRPPKPVDWGARNSQLRGDSRALAGSVFGVPMVLPEGVAKSGRAPRVVSGSKIYSVGVAPAVSVPVLTETSPGVLKGPVAEGVSASLTSAGDPGGAVQLQNGSAQVGLRPLGRSGDVAATKEPKGARWKNVFVDGSDLVEEVTASGVKGSIVVSKAPKGDPVWDFELVLSDGLVPSFGDGESVPDEFRPVGVPVRVRDKTGVVVAELPVGFAVDGAGQKTAVDLVLRASKDGRWIVSVGVDAAWFGDKARVFPVLVDPTLVRPVFTGSLTTLYEGGGSTPAAFPQMISDQYWGYGTRQSLLKVDTTDIGRSVNVGSAQLIVGVQNCDAPYAWSPYAFGVGLAPTTSAWDSTTVTWATRPSVGAEQWGNPGGYGGQMIFDVTSSVRSWADGLSPDATNPYVGGFRLQMERYAWAGQPNYCNISSVQLQVNQLAAENLPTGSMVSPANGDLLVDPNVTFALSGTDPDGDPLYFTYLVCEPNLTVCQDSRFSGWWAGGATWKPAVPLASNKAHVWRAWVWDGRSSGGVDIGTRTFTTKPGLSPPTRVAPASGATTVGAIVPGVGVDVAFAVSGGSGVAPLQYLVTACEQANLTVCTSSNAGAFSASQAFTLRLGFGRPYVWTATTKDSSGALSTTTQDWGFTTVSRPNTGPTNLAQVAPASDAAGVPRVPRTPQLSVSATDPENDPIEYQYTVCPLVPAGACLAPSLWVGAQWVSPQLSFNTQYEWTFTARDKPPVGVNTAPTTVYGGVKRKFTTIPDPAAVTAPVPIGPGDPASTAVTETSTRPFLQVSATDSDPGDQIEYRYEICSPDFPGGAASTRHCLDSGVTWTPGGWQVTSNLYFNQTYVWRAWARNVGDPGSGIAGGWTRSVLTKTLFIDDPGQLVEGFSPYIDQNYDDEGQNAVNEALGSFTYSRIDASMATVAAGVDLKRTYNTRNRRVGAFGIGWTSYLDVRLAYIATTGLVPTPNDPVVITMPDGRREYFSRNNDVYVPAGNGFFGELVLNPAGWTGLRYATKDRTQLFFDSNGRLLKILDRNANQVTYTYTSNRISRATDDRSGRYLDFVYNAAGFVASVSTKSVAAHSGPLTTNYSYTGNQLIGACPPSTTVVTGCWAYRWVDGRLDKVTKPKGNTEVEVTYDTSYYTQAATNLVGPSSSFEAALGTDWIVNGGGAGYGPGTSQGAVFGGNALVIPYGGASSNLEVVSKPVIIEPNKSYTITGRVKGASTGRVVPYAYYYDKFGQFLTSGPAGYGGESAWLTQANWSTVRGQVRTPETAKTMSIGFQWPAAQGHNGLVALDGVMLERGDGFIGRVTTRKDGRGNTTTFSYQYSGVNLEVLTDDPRPAVATSKDVYNERYQLLSHADQGNRTATYTYDANGFVETITDPAGRVLRLVNDKRGNATKRTSEWLNNRSEYYTYDLDNGFLLEFRDARSASATDNTYRTTFTQDGQGNKTSEKDSLGFSKVWSYAQGTEAAYGGTGTVPKGRLISTADRSGLVVNYGFDQLGDLRRIDHPANGVVENVTDEIGRLKSETRFLGGVAYATTTRVLDVRNRISELTGPPITNSVTGIGHQSKTVTTYDANDNPTLVTTTDVVGGDPARSMSYLYNNDDQLITAMAPLARTTSYDYDEVGNTVLTTGARGQRIRNSFNERNLPVTSVLENYFDVTAGPTRSITLNTRTYDNLGRALTITDAIGRETAFSYWDDNHIKATTRSNYVPLGGSAVAAQILYQEYDAVGNVTKETTGGTETVTTTYDARNFRIGRTIAVAAGVNRLTTFVPDKEGRVLTASTGRNVVTNTYGAASKLLASTTTSGVGASVTYGYDSLGRMTTETSGRGNVTTISYDQANQAYKSEAPLVVSWTGGVSSAARPTQLSGFNTFGEVTHGRDPRNLVTSTSRDVLGQPIVVTYPTEGGVTPTESFGYDTDGNLTSRVDRLGQTTNYAVDALGRTRTVLAPAPTAGGARPTTTVNFDDVSQQTQIVDPNGVTTGASWDLLGRQRTSSILVRQKANATLTTSFDYDLAGRATKLVDSVGKTWTTQYNGSGQETIATDPTGATTETTYEEPVGWVATTKTGGRNLYRNTFDDAGRKTKVEALNAAGTAVMATTSFGYDFDSNRISTTRPNGGVDSVTIDAAGRVTESKEQVLASTFAITGAGYDPAGNLTRIVDPRDGGTGTFVTSMTYNNWNMLASAVEPSTTAHPGAGDRTWSTVYNSGGLPTSETRPGGVTVNRAYDLLGRMTSETGAGTGATSASRTFTYDAGGRVAGAGSQTFAYFDTGTLQSSAGPAGASSFDIDNAGRTTSRTDAAGTSTFGYNDRGDLASYNVGGSAVSLTWTPDGRVNQITYPQSVTRMFTYDDMGRLGDDHTKNGSAATLARRQYTFNADSSVASSVVTESGGVAQTPSDAAQTSFVAPTPSSSRDVLLTAQYMYWTNLTTGTIGRANLDGTGVNQNFITGLDAPSGIETDGTYLYWTYGGSNDTPGTGGVGRALLDGTAKNLTFITGASKPIGLAVTATNIYWSNFAAQSVGRAALNGTGVTQSFINAGLYPFGLEVRGAYIYWTNLFLSSGAAGTNIGRADIGGTNINLAFITGASTPTGITSDGSYLYWANYGNSTIGRATLAGTGVNQAYVAATTANPGAAATPVGVAVNASHLFYTNFDGLKIARTIVTASSGGAPKSYSYAYDLGSRLTGFTAPAGTTSYAYDVAGNRVGVNGATFAFDQRNRMVSGGGLTYNWSARGTLTSTVGAGGKSYVFDGLDRLTGAGGSTYTYDSLDRVITRNGAVGFAYGGAEKDPVADGVGLYRRSAGGSLLGLSRGGVSVLTGTERHGDVAWTLNPVTGTIVDSMISDPFGQSLSVTGSRPAVGFQGDWTDSVSGLVWMGARWYDPATGQFVSRDTDPGVLGVVRTFNRYSYGLNDPLRFSDPTGRTAEYVECYRGDGSYDWSCDAGLNSPSSPGVTTSSPGDGVTDTFDSNTGCTTRRFTSGTVMSWCTTANGSEAISVSNSGAGVSATLNPDGSSIRTEGGVTTNSAAPVNTAPYTVRVGDGTVTCQAAATAGGYGRTCFYERGDGGFGVVGATGYGSVRADGTVFRSGPIDRRDYISPTLVNTGGTLNVGDAAAYIAVGADYEDAALRFDSPRDVVEEGAKLLVFDPGACEDKVSLSCTGEVIFALPSPLKLGKAFKALAKGGKAVNKAADAKKAAKAAKKAAKAAKKTATNSADDLVSAACRTNSFTPETRVLMADGTTKAIEDIKVGDQVVAFEPETGERGTRTVTDTIVGDGVKHLVGIRILTSSGESTVWATEHHPFWDSASDVWVDAGDLQVGSVLLTDDGDRVTVSGLSEVARIQRVHNLTVEGIHTYYVLAGDEAVLVHNCIRGTQGLKHSFDRHSAQWFGRGVPKETHMDAWTDLLERAAGSSKSFAWSSSGSVTRAHLARIDGKNFVVQFFVDGPRAGEVATAFVPSQRQLSAMLKVAG